MKFYRFILILFSAATFVFAGKPYWVFLDDKDLGPPVQLTAKAEARIALRGGQKMRGDKAVSTVYLNQLRAAGFKIRHVSRFLNAVSLEAENDVHLSQLNQYSFVRSIRPVAGRVERTPDITVATHLSRISDLEYGPSYTQNQILEIPRIHDYGFDATGILIAVFDTGFETDHPVFSNMDIVDRYDFVDRTHDARGVDTLREHGTMVLSAIGGYSPGELVGPAFGASYLLARTEDTNSETHAEEENWLAAVEWADSLGADIISSSLAYLGEFTDGSPDYPLSALDGETTIIARAANMAAERGILVVNSAGNEGPGTTTIWSPADSPHVLTVGAITSTGSASSFTGMGPTYDGRIKPDIVAMGSEVVIATGSTSFRVGDGTSFSAPQISGLAALLLQAHPALKPDSIISLFRQYGDRSGTPDNTYGYGVPNLISLFPSPGILSAGQSLIFPNPSFGKQLNILLPDPVAESTESVNLIDIRGRHIARLVIESTSSLVARVSLPDDLALADQLYIVTLTVGDKIYAGKLVYLKL